MTNLQLGSGTTLAEQIAGAKIIRVKHMYTDARKGYFAPRVGFAWDPTERGRFRYAAGLVCSLTVGEQKYGATPPATIRVRGLGNRFGPKIQADRSPSMRSEPRTTAPTASSNPPITPGLNPGRRSDWIPRISRRR